MASVGLPVDRVRGRLRGGVGVAAVNSSASTVVAGPADAVTGLVAELQTEDVQAKVIPVDYASHSPRVEAVEQELRGVLDGIRPRGGDVAFYSSLTGRRHDMADLDAGYWYENLRQPVDFEQATRALAADGYTVFVEASPHPVLTMAVQETVDTDLVATGSLRRGEGGMRRFLTSAAELWVRGVPVDWRPAVTGGRSADLPTYPFERRRYWPEPGQGPRPAGGAADHPLLDGAVPLAESDGLVLTGRLSRRMHPWLGEHTVNGTALLPAAAFLELAIAAGDRAGCDRVDELTLENPIVIPETGTVHVQVTVGAPDAADARPLALHSSLDDGASWTRHATGAFAGGTAPGAHLSWPPADAVPVPVDDLYARSAATGVGYGPLFQGVRGVWEAGDDLYAEVVLPAGPDGEAGRFGLHPVLLDAALQPLALSSRMATGLRPFSWSGVSLHATGASRLRVRLTPLSESEVAVLVADGAGRPVATVESLTLRPPAVPPAVPPSGADTAAARPAGPRPVRPAAAADVDAQPLEHRLAGVPAAERERILVELVRSHAAAVLGHTEPGAVPAGSAFKELGFDSLIAVEFRNRLVQATGVRLPATLVFDHPSPADVVRKLDAALTPGAATTPSGLLDGLDRLENELVQLAGDARTDVTERLRSLLWKLDDRAGGTTDETAGTDAFDPADDDEMFALIERELGGR